MKDTHITQPQFAMIWFGAALSYDSMLALQELIPFDPHIWAIAIGCLVIL